WRTRGWAAEARRGGWKDEPADHGGDAQQPGWLAGQPDEEPGVEARRLGAPGAFALAQRGGGRAYAGCNGQQDCLVHQPAPFAWLVPAGSRLLRTPVPAGVPGAVSGL